VCFYVATLIGLVWFQFPYVQWSGLIAVSVATAATVAIVDRGRWPLGLFVAPPLAARELVFGSAFGVVLIGLCALLVSLSTGTWHERGAGFPWLELVGVYIPGAVHEELLFRGYGFQKLHRWNATVALFLFALIFAGLHAGNVAVSWLGLMNIFLGGILLGLAYERYGRLWFPIGLHLAWNVMSGPILGHEVSGYDSPLTVFVERGSGPVWLTGGEFGIEGSAWMTVTELIAIVALWSRSNMIRARRVLPGAEKKELPL
jgi:membrane protease YdiL (CAAX protease family)